jgi:hypothetical protein
LQGVCSGDVEIWAKIDRVLYGTAATQAGRQDVRLVVQPIR